MCSALVPSPARSAAPVHVVLVVIRAIVIDDELEFFDVETSSTDGRCHENFEFSAFEIGDDGIAIVLRKK